MISALGNIVCRLTAQERTQRFVTTPTTVILSKVLFVIHSGVAERDASSKVSWLNPKELILSRI